MGGSQGGAGGFQVQQVPNEGGWPACLSLTAACLWWGGWCSGPCELSGLERIAEGEVGGASPQTAEKVLCKETCLCTWQVWPLT